MFLNNLNSKTILLKVLVLSIMVSAAISAFIGNEPRIVHKKSFSDIGCLGNNDQAKFARLDKICEECHQIYRGNSFNDCREFCFKNELFPACVDALLLSHEQKELNQLVEELLGK